ncbi:MAG: OstA-like protein [candidate division KSB1 bacterium]|nr:OstA-like protein [candidate division KSB1 bacterium]
MRNIIHQFRFELITIAILVVLFGRTAYPQVESQERLVLESAERLENTTEDGQVVRRLYDNVQFRQGSALLRCDLAMQYTRDLKTVFRGNVFLQDEARTLTANELTYYEHDKTYVALGNVVFKNGPTTLFCEELIYDSRSKHAEARTLVRLYNEKERIQLTSEFAEYFREREYARMTEHPVMVQFDSTGREETRILGDVMESFDGGKRIKVTGNVRIFHDETRAQCQTAEYVADEKKVVLTDQPVAWQNSDELRGEVIELHLQDRKIREVHVINQAIAFSEADSNLVLDQPNVLSGQQIVFYLSDGEVERIVVEGTATSIYNMIEEGEFKGVNWVQGDRIELMVENRTVKRVRIESKPVHPPASSCRQATR